MKNYILPRIFKYDNIEDLLSNERKRFSFLDTRKTLSIDDLLAEDFICVVGEPGIGKTKLVEEICGKNIEGLKKYNASKFEPQEERNDTKLCIIDALDEVDGSQFISKLKLIVNYKNDNLGVKVLFTCRKHYVESYSRIFSTYNNLAYAELSRLKDEDVKKIAGEFSEQTKESVSKSPKLKELLTIPRYLTFLEERDEEQNGCSNIGELFEYIVGKTINQAIKNSGIDGIKDNVSFKILVQRVLEKVAFVMEISRKDQITKDELYSILDGVKGNLTQLLVANFDLLFFQSRILKETNEVLQFDNAELQEYLAAKELCRFDNLESVLYDVAVDKELRHIHPNWYDVIPHISYIKEQMASFINVVKLIVSYESNFENKSFESLLRYVDPAVCSLEEKTDIFNLLLDHYLKEREYIGWNSQIPQLMHDCYSSCCSKGLMSPYDNSNRIQFANIIRILEAIGVKLDKEVIDYWKIKAKNLWRTHSIDNKLNALDLYFAIRERESLIQLSRNFNKFTPEEKQKYYQVTDQLNISDPKVLDCWLTGCFDRNPHAISAVLRIEEPVNMAHAYNGIIENHRLFEFLHSKGSEIVFYVLYLDRQFEIAKDNIDAQKLVAKVVAAFVNMSFNSTRHEINVLIKRILLNQETGLIFVQCFEHKWDLVYLFYNFSADLVDIDFVSALKNLLEEVHMEQSDLDEILIHLVSSIRTDESKQIPMREYIERYQSIFDQWDKKSAEAESKRQNNIPYYKEYEALSAPNVQDEIKYRCAFELSKNVEFLKQQELRPFVQTVDSFFDNLNLDSVELKKAEGGYFSISQSLVLIPNYVNALWQIGERDILARHRMKLAMTLPIAGFTGNFEKNEIKTIYKEIIGNLEEQEKRALIQWWKLRTDDLMKMSHEDIISCILYFGLDALSYKLEEYINEYVEKQDIHHQLAASESLSLIAKGYCNWDFTRYRTLFANLKCDEIDSIKMQCNSIIIEKYQDVKAIEWRFNYLKTKVVESRRDYSSMGYALSKAEYEMLSSTPQIFKPFMSLQNNELVVRLMFDLFDFGLSLCDDGSTQEYSSYLLNQIYLFFVEKRDVSCMMELRKKVEHFNYNNNGNYLANAIMNKNEMIYLPKAIIPINKSIKLYNKSVETEHLQIRNNADFRRYFSRIHLEVQKEIQDQGIYSIVSQDTLKEDFIQRELKNTIMNKCCQMGLEVSVDREVALQDNKRTDLLIRYGLCNPIMIELKLLNNSEIQNNVKRLSYKTKFVQYSKATNACLSVFWEFNVHKGSSNTAKFDSLKKEYEDLDNTMVLLTDCKCSSAVETGKPSKITNKKGNV